MWKGLLCGVGHNLISTCKGTTWQLGFIQEKKKRISAKYAAMFKVACLIKKHY